MSRNRAVSAVTSAVNARERSFPRYRGWLKAVSGSVHVSGRAGYVYIQRRDVGTDVQLDEVRMPNVNVPDIDGFPVIIGRNSIWRNEDVVLGRDIDAKVSWLYDYDVKGHRVQHEAGGFDMVYVYDRALVSLRVCPQDTPDLTIKINTGWYSTLVKAEYFAGDASVDLSASVPASGQRWCIIGINEETGAVETLDGDIISTAVNLSISDMPTIPKEWVTLAAVQMYIGQTVIAESNIFDMRVTAGGWAGTLETWEDGVLVVDASRVINFSGDGVTVSESPTGQANVVISGGTGTSLTVQDDNVTEVNGCTIIDFTGEGVSVVGVGTEAQVYIPGASASSITVQEDNVTRVDGCVIFDFTGDGVSVVGDGTEAKIYIPGASSTSLTVQDDNVTEVTGCTILDFTGGGVSVIGSGSEAQIYIPGATSTDFSVQDDGVTEIVACTILDFSGDGVSVTPSGTEAIVQISGILYERRNKGIESGCVISDGGGTTVDWTAGVIFYDGVRYNINSAVGQALTDNSPNYVYFDQGVSTDTLQISTTIPTDDDQVLCGVICVQAGDVVGALEQDVAAERIADISSALAYMFPVRILSGGVMSAYTADAASDLDVAMTAMDTILNGHKFVAFAASNSKDTAMRTHYHDAADAWDSGSANDVDTANYDDPDDGQGLIAIPNNKWVRGMFHFSLNKINYVYPTTYYDTKAQAEAAPNPATPPGMTRCIPLAAIVFQEGETDISDAEFLDMRPANAVIEGTPVTDHGDLAGLLDNDHPFYQGMRYVSLLRDGVMTEYTDPDDAFTAADTAGDVVLIPPGTWTLSAAHSTVASVFGLGAPTECILSATTDVGDLLVVTGAEAANFSINYIYTGSANDRAAFSIVDGWARNLHVTHTNDDDGDVSAVVADNSTLIHVYGTADCTGDGNANGLNCTGTSDTVYLKDCWFVATSTGGQSRGCYALAVGSSVDAHTTHFEATDYGLTSINDIYARWCCFSGTIDIAMGGISIAYLQGCDYATPSGTITPLSGDRAAKGLNETISGAWTFDDDITMGAGKTVDGIELSTHDHSGAAGMGVQLDWDDVWDDAVHDHSADGEGGTLAWNDVWSDAVHDHSSDAEGGSDLLSIVQFQLATTTALTIDAGGEVTKTQSYHSIETNGGGASDDLVTINGGTTCDLLLIRPADDGHTIVVKHNTGNIWLCGKTDISLDDINDHLLLWYDGSKWADTNFGAGGALADHTHTGPGDGGQLDWDDIWSDAVHDHSADGEGGQLTWGSVWADGEHTHADAANGGQLDWDDVWSDAVHNHSADGEGGTLDWDDVWADAVHDHSAAGEGDQLSRTAMAGQDTDAYFIFGRAFVGYDTSHSDYASFGHVDQQGNTTYSILVSATGTMYLNCSSGKDMYFRVANTTEMQLDEAGLRIANGLWVGGIGSAPDDNDITYEGDLHPYRNASSLTGYVYVPITQTVIWNNLAKSAGTHSLDMSSYGCAAGCKAVNLALSGQWASTGATRYMYARKKGSAEYQCVVRSRVANQMFDNDAVVACDTNGDIDIVIGFAIAVATVIVTGYYI